MTSLNYVKNHTKKVIPKYCFENLMRVTNFSPALPLCGAEVHCVFLALLFCPLPAILKFPLHVFLKQLGYVNHVSISV